MNGAGKRVNQGLSGGSQAVLLNRKVSVQPFTSQRQTKRTTDRYREIVSEPFISPECLNFPSFPEILSKLST